jgi:hypothetical protein
MATQHPCVNAKTGLAGDADGCRQPPWRRWPGLPSAHPSRAAPGAGAPRAVLGYSRWDTPMVSHHRQPAVAPVHAPHLLHSLALRSHCPRARPHCGAMLIPERIRLWREDAAVLRRRGARRAAAHLERVAAELEDDLTQPGVQPELLTLANAVEQSGYTRGHLRRLLVAGTLTNHGTEDRPLVAASDLPRKLSRPSSHFTGARSSPPGRPAPPPHPGRTAPR